MRDFGDVALGSFGATVLRTTGDGFERTLRVGPYHQLPKLSPLTAGSRGVEPWEQPRLAYRLAGTSQSRPSRVQLVQGKGRCRTASQRTFRERHERQAVFASAS